MFESGYVYVGNGDAYLLLRSCPGCGDLIRAYLDTLRVYYNRFNNSMPMEVRKELLVALSSKVEVCEYSHSDTAGRFRWR